MMKREEIEAAEVNIKSILHIRDREDWVLGIRLTQEASSLAFG